MSIQTAHPASRQPSAAADGPTVWDRLWTQPPSEARDRSNLDRERRGRRWRHVVARLKRVHGDLPRLRTIELGSGRGDLSVLLAQQGADVTLLDTSDRALEAAKERFDGLGLTATFLRGDLLDPDPYLRGRYDAALSLGVIEHFRGAERAQAVRGHFDVLAAGGLAVISVPYAWCLPYRVWKAYLQVRRRWPYGMEIPYSRTEMKRCAESAGFDRIELKTLGLWQSIGDQWCRGVLKIPVEWEDRASVLDPVMGLVLLAFGWKTV